MNFETILFAAAFLLLGVMSLSRNDTPPVDQAAINEDGTSVANTSPVENDLLSTEAETETSNDESTEAQVD